MKKHLLTKTLLMAVMLLGGVNFVWAQSAYWTEDFEDALGTGWTLSTSPAASLTSNSSESVAKKLGSQDLRIVKSGSYIITPSLDQGVSTITFWQCRSSNRTLTIYTSIDDGTNWTKHSDISASSSAIATVTINNPFVNRIKITNESNSDADLDDLTVYHKNVVWKENYESYTDVSQISSAWTNNGSNYQATLNLCSNECGNSSKWLLTYSGNSSRQTTEYYMFASAYTGKAYRFDAKLNMNDGNNNSSESRLYIMNGAKASNNNDPSNYLFYIGVNSSGKAYISNGTDSETSTIGGLNSGTNSIAATKWTKTYRSTGWFDASCIIDLERGNVKVTLSSGSTNETFTISLKSGSKQLSGLCVRGGAKLYGVVALDDLALYELTYPAFTLSNDSKNFYVEDDVTVSVTSIIGDISVESSDIDVATASYSDGTVTIHGVAEGTATVTVAGQNDGLTITKTIDVTVGGYTDKYTAAKAPYDTKVATLDAAGQSYWAANVTDPATVTTSEAYATAVAALPTTYIAAVKAQGAGSDMTDAMPTGNAGWTCSQGNGPATVKETFTETYGAESAFVEGNIMSQTITGLQNGYYKVQFYGVVNAARSPSALTVNTDGLAQAYANSTNEEITVYYQDDCTPSDYLHTIEAQVTDGTLTYGLKAKTGVTDAGNWAVAKIYKLTYLGTDKNSYTINAVAGETTIKELATGTQWASEDYGTYIPKVILYNSKYYVLDDEDNANLDGYYASYTMGASNETKEINYTLDESVVYFYDQTTEGTNKDYSSGNDGYCGAQNKRDRGYSVGTLSKGIYQFTANITAYNRRSIGIRQSTNDHLASVGTSNSDKTLGEKSKNFRLTEETSSLFVNGANSGTDRTNQSEDFDYVLIRKLNVNDDPVIIGEIDNSTDYLTDMTDKVTLKPGESYHYQFVNHNSNGSDNSKNWVLPVYDSSDTKTIVVRADNWEDVAGANSGCTNNFDWTNFISEMDGATVDMTVSFTTDKKFTMSADIVTSSANNWTYSYTSDYSGTAIDFSDDNYIKVALSVSLSWLEILSEEQTVISATIPSSGYGSLASAYGLDFSDVDGLTAYVVTQITNEKVKLTSVDELPANSGMILKGTAGSTYSIPVKADAAYDGTNLLSAAVTATPIEANTAYILQSGAFHLVNAASTIPAGKAYLLASNVPSGARAMKFVFDDETTAVSEELRVKSKESATAPVYNLKGQRVAQPTKGLYIKNGKKVVVK